MEPGLHYLIPLIALLAIFPKFCKEFGYKKILLLGILAVISDIDTLAGMHRYLFHNIFFVFIVVLIIWLSLGRISGLLGIYFLGSHLLFDMNRAGVALLWPICNKFLGFEIGVIHYKLEGFKIILDFFSEPFSITESFNTSWYIHPMGSLIFILVGILLIIRLRNLLN